LYTPCILDCALRFSNKNFYLLIKKKKGINTKQPSFRWDLPQLVLPFPSHS
jgi:hypothetical protein